MLTAVQTGFRKPIVLTGSQLPLAMPRSDARQNLIDSVTCLTSFFSPPHIRLEEVAICFGGRLMRGNRCQKVISCPPLFALVLLEMYPQAVCQPVQHTYVADDDRCCEALSW
jgi:Asparaginase, N-terminal